MGVIIGSLMDGSALCVEAPESPSIKIGEPTAIELKAQGARVPEMVYGMIGPARQVSVTRIFTLRKKDISSVTNWLASLVGTSLKHNAGSDTSPTIPGDFKLDGDITFTSDSPTLTKASATFIGHVLDCNYALPAGLEYRKLSSTESAIFIDNAERTRWTTKDKGDESGIVFKAGRSLFWDEVPAPDRESLQVTYSGEINPDAEATPRMALAYSSSYREIHLTVNGYIVKTWYVPCYMRHRVRAIYPRGIWYGQTQDEYEADGPPVFTELTDLSDANNPRLSGGMNPRTYSYGTLSHWRDTLAPLPVGEVLQWLGYSRITNPDTFPDGWTPTASRVLRWHEPTFGKNPNPYSRIYLIGYGWVSSGVSETWWSPFHSDDEVTVSLGWARTDEGLFLTAIGANGQTNTLLEYLA